MRLRRFFADAFRRRLSPNNAFEICCGLLRTAIAASSLVFGPSSMNPYTQGPKTGTVLALTALAASRDDFVRIVTVGKQNRR